jgi:hypothetical protein
MARQIAASRLHKSECSTETVVSDPADHHRCCDGRAQIAGARLRASRALRLYRIFPVAELIRITGLLVTVAAILSAVAFPRGIRAAVFMAATALLSFGAADVTQEAFAMRARRRRSDAIIGGPKAQTWWAVARMIAGLTCLMLSFVGFMIWASVTTEV